MLRLPCCCCWDASPPISPPPTRVTQPSLDGGWTKGGLSGGLIPGGGGRTPGSRALGGGPLNGGRMKGGLKGRGCWKGPGAIEVLLSFLLSTGGLRGGRTKFRAPRESRLRRCGGGGSDVTNFTCGQVYWVNGNRQGAQQVHAI